MPRRLAVMKSAVKFFRNSKLLPSLLAVSTLLLFSFPIHMHFHHEGTVSGDHSHQIDYHSEINLGSMEELKNAVSVKLSPDGFAKAFQQLFASFLLIENTLALGLIDYKHLALSPNRAFTPQKLFFRTPPLRAPPV